MSMKIVKVLALLLLCNLANAMDGVFDRSEEVNRYVGMLGSSVGPLELIDVSKQIYVSGISDARLAKAIAERLMKDLPKITIGQSDNIQYGAWMVKALAATGDPSAKEVISEVIKTTKAPRIRSEAEEQINEIEWHHRANEVMASRKNFNEGDDMRVAMLLNELQSDDFSLKQDAAYRMSWDKILDPKLMVEIAKQVQTYVDNGKHTDNKAEMVVMSHYVKMLGYSGNAEYKPLIRKLLGTPYLIDRQVHIALKRL